MRSIPVNTKVYLLLFLICLAGVLLRLYNLEVKGLWLDEIHSAIGVGSACGDRGVHGDLLSRVGEHAVEIEINPHIEIGRGPGGVGHVHRHGTAAALGH